MTFLLLKHCPVYYIKVLAIDHGFPLNASNRILSKSSTIIDFSLVNTAFINFVALLYYFIFLKSVKQILGFLIDFKIFSSTNKVTFPKIELTIIIAEHLYNFSSVWALLHWANEACISTYT